MFCIGPAELCKRYADGGKKEAVRWDKNIKIDLTLMRVACQPTVKEWLVGLLIPTDVGLLYQ